MALLLPPAATPAHSQAAAPETLILTHANVIDGIGETPIPDTTVVVVEGRIKSIGEASAREGRVID
jgi:hypothetical protein